MFNVADDDYVTQTWRPEVTSEMQSTGFKMATATTDFTAVTLTTANNSLTTQQSNSMQTTRHRLKRSINDVTQSVETKNDVIDDVTCLMSVPDEHERVLVFVSHYLSSAAIKIFKRLQTSADYIKC